MLVFRIRCLFATRQLLYAEKLPSTSPNPQSKPNLVVIHGVLGTGNLYRHLAEFSVTRANYNSYLLDLPNHGKSFRTETTSIPSMGDDVAYWIKEQKFEKDVTMVAHSLGGRVAIAMTAQHPQLQDIVKNIILLDAAPNSYVGFPFVKKTEQHLQQLKTIDLSGSKEDIQSQIRKISSNEVQFKMLMTSVDFVKKDWTFNLETLSKSYMDLINFHIDKADWKGQIYAIKALKSEFINDHSKAQFKRIYPNIRISDVDCYHNIQLEKPFAVFDIINRV